MQPAKTTEVIFISGRSGVGKTSVAAELSRLFAIEDIVHALIEGDNLDQAHPEPWRDGIDLAEQNLAAMWRNYRAAGYSRLIFTNTVSVLEMPSLSAALGADVSAIGALLTANDSTAADRLAQREIGSGLEDAIKRSKAAAAKLQLNASSAVHRISTDRREVCAIATEVKAISGWGGAEQ
ncbi:adenylyl-sulfate kinase [Nakamurella antarctica]|uniref:Adenylyl-sulfate kinase n=1 Tax=Nakamurella antarctica TaxID=1902245 RepID=A0A3G8ZPP9_9ACTN|nr:AAA family ATPase [Nakamurella antarctica]AZI59209.1 adenylyl-sulfate kinase [Nakamurella antarctica]